MQTPSKEAMRELIAELRAIPPRRPVTYGESIRISHVQAAHYRHWAGATQPDINLIGLVKQRLIPVNFVPAYRLVGTDGTPKSGMTTNAVGGKLQVFINQNEPEVRQRFSLLHEPKHVLDF